jgi:predicted ferric reductase
MMTPILLGLLTLVAATWFGALAAVAFPPGTALPWILRQEGMYLTGLGSIALMSLSMLLATRPVWLEKPLGGMDRIYRLHKWSGILAISLGASHWLIELSGDIIKAFIGKEGRVPKVKYTGLLEQMRKLAEDMGEWALYAALAILVLTLWKRFPYHLWRQLHRVMPALYLTLAFHAVLLAPPAYWTQPIGALLAMFIALGVVSSFIALAGLIGRRRQVAGTVVAINCMNDVTEIACRLEGKWASYRPGQFAFITFDRQEGAHPFTISSADRGNGTISFCIKALGNYTNDLAQKLRVGQAAKIEGPYGRFQLDRHSPDKRQVWVAGGIGVTPFLAWLESLQARPEDAPQADLHYCTRDRETDPFVGRLQALCAGLPSIRLQLHGARQGEMLSSVALKPAEECRRKTEVWFCGPRTLADALKQGLNNSCRGGLRFHQEAFEMR